MAQAARDKRDPVKVELQKIAESEAAKDAVRLKPLSEALEQWLSGMKTPGESSDGSLPLHDTHHSAMGGQRGCRVRQ